MKPYSSAVLLAISFLQKMLQSDGLKVGDRLPLIEELARSAHVSKTSMIKAIAVLKSAKVLATKKGKGTFVGKVDVAEKINLFPHSINGIAEPIGKYGNCKWCRVRNSIYSDIVTGNYNAGVKLPSTTMLCERYGVHRTTLKKALDELVQVGVLIPRRNSYIVPPYSSRRFNATVMVIGPLNKEGGYFDYSRHREFIQALEKHCLKTNFKIEVAGFESRGGNIEIYSPRGEIVSDEKIKSLDFLMGFIVLNWDSSPLIPLFIERLCRFEKPVAVLDEIGHEGIKELLQKRRNLLIVSMANSSLASYQIGKYLLRLGHRYVAYLSPIHRDIWSKNRMRGLVQAFEEANLFSHVIPFTLEQYSRYWDFLPISRGSDSIFSWIPTFEKTYEHIIDMINDIHHAFSPFKKKALFLLTASIKSLESIEAMRYHSQVLFEKALNTPNITAWVCCNDMVATHALEFLHEQKIAVPARISLVGFDDEVEAYKNGITSYNFNIPLIATRILNYIIKWPPAKQNLFKNNSVLEFDGIIIERNTTRALISAERKK